MQDLRHAQPAARRLAVLEAHVDALRTALEKTRQDYAALECRVTQLARHFDSEAQAAVYAGLASRYDIPLKMLARGGLK